jgi:hypothetical protein
MTRWLLFIPLLIVAGIAGGVLLTRAQVLAAPEQPIAYSHRAHVEAGVQCLFCHPSALRSPMAGIPSVQKCMGCHAVIEADNPAIQEVAGYWERGEPIPWVRVNAQPDFVFFSHQPHLGAGLNCETCHGDVGSMTVPAGGEDGYGLVPGLSLETTRGEGRPSGGLPDMSQVATSQIAYGIAFIAETDGHGDRRYAKGDRRYAMRDTR